MALPEDQVAALQASTVAPAFDRLAERRFLHVAVARTGDAARRSAPPARGRNSRCRDGLAAPQIGRAQEPFGDRDRVRFLASIGARCRAGMNQPRRVTANAPSLAHDRNPRAERQRLDRWQLDDGPGKQACAAPRPCASGRRRAPARRPASSRHSRRGKLAPGPAFARLVDVTRSPFSASRHERRIGDRRAAHRRAASTTSKHRPRQSAPPDVAFEMLGREVGRAGVMRGSRSRPYVR